jgi:hypothetical protein
MIFGITTQNDVLKDHSRWFARTVVGALAVDQDGDSHPDNNR